MQHQTIHILVKQIQMHAAHAQPSSRSELCDVSALTQFSACKLCGISIYTMYIMCIVFERCYSRQLSLYSFLSSNVENMCANMSNAFAVRCKQTHTHSLQKNNKYTNEIGLA